MTQKQGLILLGIFLVLGISVQLYKKQSRDAKIKNITNSEAEIRKLCTSEDVRSRIKCLRPKLELISKSNFPKKFILIKADKVIPLDSTEFKGYVKIDRNEDMSFGGQCVSTFYLFDFDGSSVYVSKDNKSGVIFCKNKGGEFVIASAELSSEKIKEEIKTLLNLAI